MDLDSIFEFAIVDSYLLDHNSSPEVGIPLTPQSQVSTPPNSSAGTPISDNNDLHVSISTTFHAHAHWQSIAPDLIFSSSDLVLFYVHSQVLLHASENSFRSLIPTFTALPPHQSPTPVQTRQHLSNTAIHVAESSLVLNVILHAIYGLSCSPYAPSFETLSTAVDQLPLYGVNPKTCIAVNAFLYALLLSHAPLLPLDVYTLAAKHDLYDLAVSASPHLLSFPLSTLTDEMAKAMGAKYLRKMFFLHMGRTDALKRLLVQPPLPHAPTSGCTFADQRALTRAWALAAAYIAWDPRPDTSNSLLGSTLAPLAERLTCQLCKKILNDRIKELVVQWSVVKRTI